MTAEKQSIRKGGRRRRQTGDRSRVPAGRPLLDDGRNFVRYGTKQYDLITLEPLQMYQKGVAYFYTQDFYREARARMTPGGVIRQWAPLYLMDPHEFASIIKSFVDVFPNSLMWGRRGHSMVLLGYNDDRLLPDFDESRTL